MDIRISAISTPRGVLTEATVEEARQAGATEADIAAAIAAHRAGLARSECRRRIYRQASAETQMNMTAAVAAIGAKSVSSRSEEEEALLAAYGSSLEWVAAMRGRAGELAADPQADLAADASWPPVPADAAAFAARF